MATDKMKVKDYSDTFLYRKGNYSKALFDFMMHADFVSPTDPVIKDLVSEKDYKSIGYVICETLVKEFDIDLEYLNQNPVVSSLIKLYLNKCKKKGLFEKEEKNNTKEEKEVRKDKKKKDKKNKKKNKKNKNKKMTKEETNKSEEVN